MLSYIASAERVFEVDLEELTTGEAPSTSAAAERSATSAEVESYEEGHPAPEVVIPTRDRIPTIQ